MNSRSDKFVNPISLAVISIFVALLFGCVPLSQPEPPQPASVQAIAEGDIENGQKLFMGYAHFENEGPPCMGCHNLGEYGLLGGGALGPDLTNVSSERSDIELASVLSNNRWTKSPVMEPIYTQHPLTENEQADLIAFMKSSAGEPQEDKELLVLGISILATIGAAIAIGFVYRNRLRRIRAAMVKEAEKELL